MSGPREVRAPRGTELSCKGWPQEAAMRMLMNNLDPEVAEYPDDLIVYGGTGRAARSWDAFDAIVRSLQALDGDETLLVQSGKPVGIFRTHEWAPRVLIANSNLVPEWATWDEFRRLEALGLTMYGQMTAGSWIYIASQGIVQGTYECFAEIARRRFGDSLAGTITLTADGCTWVGNPGSIQATIAPVIGRVAVVNETDTFANFGIYRLNEGRTWAEAEAWIIAENDALHGGPSNPPIDFVTDVGSIDAPERGQYPSNITLSAGGTHGIVCSSNEPPPGLIFAIYVVGPLEVTLEP